MTDRHGRVDIGGATLRYVVVGRGTPVLVVGSAVYYPRTFSRRLSRSCCLAFADLRHFAEHHHSIPQDTISLDTYADDIEQLRARIGFDRFVLVGHSHHGNLALEYAKRHPERVSHLVLLAAPPCNVQQTIEAADRYWQTHATSARKALVRQNQQTISACLATMEPERAFVAQYVADGPRYWYNAAFDASPLWDDVPVNIELLPTFRSFFATDYAFTWDPDALRAPLLSVMGTHDYAVPHLLWESVLPALENVTYHLLQKCGHTPQLERQETFDRVFLEWLDQTRTSHAVERSR